MSPKNVVLFVLIVTLQVNHLLSSRKGKLRHLKDGGFVYRPRNEKPMYRSLQYSPSYRDHVYKNLSKNAKEIFYALNHRKQLQQKDMDSMKAEITWHMKRVGYKNNSIILPSITRRYLSRKN